MAERDVRISLVAQVSNFVSGMNQAQRAARQSADAAQEAARKYEEQSQAMTSAGKGLMAAGAVALVATGLAVKAAIDWESAWAGVTKTVDGTPEQMAELEGSLRSLARTLPATHQEIAAVAEAAGQLGVKRADVAEFTKTMIDLAETTNLTADEAATSIAQLMNIFQTAPEDVDNLGAALVALGNDGASTERDIVQMAQRIAGAGRVIGLTEAEVLAFANALASVGIEAEAGGSSISRIMTDIAMAVSAGGEDLEKFAKVAGMSSADFSKAFKETPAEAITTFIEGLGRINDSGGDVFATLSELGQTDIRVSQALLGMANSGDLLRKSLDLGSKAWEENTALADEAAKRYETTEAKLQIAGNAAVDAAISFGSVFLPAVSAVAEAVAGFSGMLASLPEGILAQVAVLTVLATAISLAGGAFLIAVPKIAAFSAALAIMRASELPGVARAAGLVTTSITATAGALGRTAAFLSGPWGIALAAAGLGVAGLQQALDSLKATSAEYENAIRNATTAQELFAVSDRGTPVSTLQGAIKDAETFKSKLDKIANDPVGKGFDIQAQQLAANLGRLGKELGLLAATDLPAAQAGFRILADEYRLNGEEQQWLLGTMDEYENALVTQANNLNVQTEGLSEAEQATALLSLATGDMTAEQEAAADATMAAAAATEEAKAAQEEYLKALNEGDAAFVGLGTALSTIQEKQKAWATQTAEDTESSKDSWEDYYDGFSLNLQDYLAELQAQVDAQSAWETNMVLLAGRASQGVIQELASMGPEGAPLVAELVNASDEEMAKFETLFAERGTNATGSFANTLITASPVIAAAAAQLGKDAAAEIAAKLASGTTTVEQVMREYKLKVEGVVPTMDINTLLAERKIEDFKNRYGNIQGVINYRAVTTDGAIGGRAGGGWIPGAPSHRDNVLVPMATGEFVTRTREAQKPANRMWLEYMNSGGEMPAFGSRGLAGGGYVQPQYASSSPSFGPSRTITIAPKVYAAPGMDENALVRKVVRAVEEGLK